MKDYVLKNKPEPAANETVWAFDLGHPLRLERGEDRGEVSNPGHQKTAVRRGNEFLHKASLPWRVEAKRRRLIPAEFAETKTAAGRRRMWRTRL
jgi:hypothetical protein